MQHKAPKDPGVDEVPRFGVFPDCPFEIQNPNICTPQDRRLVESILSENQGSSIMVGGK